MIIINQTMMGYMIPTDTKTILNTLLSFMMLNLFAALVSFCKLFFLWLLSLSIFLICFSKMETKKTESMSESHDESEAAVTESVSDETVTESVSDETESVSDETVTESVSDETVSESVSDETVHHTEAKTSSDESDQSYVSSYQPNISSLAYDTFLLKIQYNKTLKRVVVTIVDGYFNFNMDDLRFRIRYVFGLPHYSELELKYIDEDGELITMTDENDLVDIMSQKKLQYLRMYVKLISGTTTSTHNLEKSNTMNMSDLGDWVM